MRSLSSRVAHLERQIRFHRTVTVLALLALVTLTALGASHDVPEVIRAGRFEVVDETGRPLVTLKATTFGGHVQTLGRDGISGVSIGAGSTGGFVGVRDDKATLFPRVELSVDDAGGTLAVRSWRGFAVEVDRDGLAIAHTQESEGVTRVDPRLVLSVSEDGGRLRLLNATGGEAVTLRAAEDGTGIVSTHGPDGAARTLRPAP